jgi:hypothetical protein
MSHTRRIVMGLVWLSAAGMTTGCNGGLSAATSVAQYTFKIPPGRPARPKISAEEAAMLYPDVEHLARDPFLTLAEEALYDHKELLVPEDAKVAVAPVVVARAPRKVRPPVDTVVAQLKAQVHQIILGRHNTFIFKDKYYEEGDTIDGSQWVVVSINEAHIKLQTKDGKQQQTLNFGSGGSGGGGILEITPSH